MCWIHCRKFGNCFCVVIVIVELSLGTFCLMFLRCDCDCRIELGNVLFAKGCDVDEWKMLGEIWSEFQAVYWLMVGECTVM